MDSGVFPGNQGGPLEHVIAAKAIAFGEALEDSFLHYMLQVKKNATAMAESLYGAQLWTCFGRVQITI